MENDLITFAISSDFISSMPAACLTSHHVFFRLAFSYTFNIKSLSFRSGK